MADGPHTIHIVTSDEALLSSARAAVSALEGWSLERPDQVADILRSTPRIGDVILLDGGTLGSDVYVSCREMSGNTRCRTFVVVDEEKRALAEPIANFCGATGALTRPLSADKLREVLTATEPKSALDSDGRGAAPVEDGPMLPERLLADLAAEPSRSLVDALIDPETSLFNYEFLTYKLDEEFKRAKRFRYPLSCVMLGFEGTADETVLGKLSSIFLSASRDTDVLGRFDESSFLFLLPSTGPDGAAIMARRIGALAEDAGLRDLVGDALAISVGISTYPHDGVTRREDLYARAREAFFAARQEGGGLIHAG